MSVLRDITATLALTAVVVVIALALSTVLVMAGERYAAFRRACDEAASQLPPASSTCSACDGGTP